MRPAHGLVVARAPVPGEVKTRLAAGVGPVAAAELAAAALLDTLDTCTAAFGAGRCHLALSGGLDGAASEAAIRSALAGWTVFPQVGGSLGERIAHAHREVGCRSRAPVVQIGMDTPQVTGGLLLAAADGLSEYDAVLGPADDGGWWLLALRVPIEAAAVAAVPMSTSTTGARTAAALRRAGLTVGRAPVLQDVDTADDATTVALASPGSRFARAWTECRTGGLAR